MLSPCYKWSLATRKVYRTYSATPWGWEEKGSTPQTGIDCFTGSTYARTLWCQTSNNCTLLLPLAFSCYLFSYWYCSLAYWYCSSLPCLMLSNTLLTLSLSPYLLMVSLIELMVFHALSMMSLSLCCLVGPFLLLVAALLLLLHLWLTSSCFRMFTHLIFNSCVASPVCGGLSVPLLFTTVALDFDLHDKCVLLVLAVSCLFACQTWSCPVDGCIPAYTWNGLVVAGTPLILEVSFFLFFCVHTWSCAAVAGTPLHTQCCYVVTGTTI